MSREHVECSLCGTVAVALRDWDPDAVDGANIDDSSGIVRGRGGSEGGGQAHGEGEDPLNVGSDHPIPGRLRKLPQRGAPGGSCVVDQNVERLDTASYGPGKFRRAVGCRESGDD